MNNFTISQTEPISSLPRNYANLLKKARRKKEPIIFLKRNRPVGALLAWELLKELIEIREKMEEKIAINTILKSEKEHKAGKTKVLKSLADFE